jgi:molybdopterin converting factor small subunit
MPGPLVKVKLLPRGDELLVEANTVRELLERVVNELGIEGNVYVLVNDVLVTDYSTALKQGDRVVVVEEFLGG